MNLLLVLLGAFFLYLGGEALVKNAVRLARTWGMSPLVVGLTVVAFGTSSPELVATLIAATRGAPAIALGNVIGSNIANLGLILGLTTLIYPIRTNVRVIRREVPIMLFVSLLLPLLIIDQSVGRLEGLGLLALLAPYLWLLLRTREGGAFTGEFEQEYGVATVPLWRVLAGVGLAIGLLVVGAHSLVEGGVGLARAIGVSERVIGVSLVAFGTSLPELATALVAAFRREADIVIGNLVGSNIFNVLAVLGTTALVVPLHVTWAGTRLDLAVMLAFSIVVVPFLVTGHRISRLEGGVLLLSYAAYIGFLYR